MAAQSARPSLTNKGHILADVKISQLPAATTPLAGTEQIPLVQGTTTKQVTVDGLFTSANLGTPSAISLTNATNVPVDQATGVLPVNHGGTGTTTPSIVAGTNVTVSGTWPNQTINASGGTITDVTASSPVVSSGGSTPNISMAAASASANGYLTSTDWNTFNNKQPAGSYLTSGGALGTPSSGTATNLTGLPLTTGVTGTLPVGNGGTGATTLTGIVKGNGTSAFSAATAGTDYVAPGGALGTPSSGTATNLTGLPLSTGVTGLLPVANGGTGTATPALVAGTNVTITGTWPNQTINSSGGGGSMVYPGVGIPNSTGSAWGTSYSTTGSGTVVALATSPTFVTPALGTPTSATLTNATGLPLTSGVTGTLPIANGGTSATTAAAAITALTGTQTNAYYLRSNGASAVLSALSAADLTGTVAIASGGSGQSTAQGAMNAFAGAVTSGSYLRGNGTNVVMSTIQAADVPTLNQNTTGTAAGLSATLAVASGGTGVTTSTGTGSVVLSTSPTLVTPVLGTPTSATLTNATGLPLSTGVTGTLPIANGGTGATTLAGASIVTYTGTETLTNKTLTNPTVTNYVETLYAANTGTAITVSLANGTVQQLTLTGNATITMPTAVAGKSFIIMLKQDATGSRSVTWTTVVWPGGTAPTITGTASKQDIYSFFSDGTNWYGTTVGQNY